MDNYLSYPLKPQHPRCRPKCTTSRCLHINPDRHQHQLSSHPDANADEHPNPADTDQPNPYKNLHHIDFKKQSKTIAIQYKNKIKEHINNLIKIAQYKSWKFAQFIFNPLIFLTIHPSQKPRDIITNFLSIPAHPEITWAFVLDKGIPELVIGLIIDTLFLFILLCVDFSLGLCFCGVVWSFKFKWVRKICNCWLFSCCGLLILIDWSC